MKKAFYTILFIHAFSLFSFTLSYGRQNINLVSINPLTNNYLEIYQRPYPPYDYFIQDNDGWMWHLAEIGGVPEKSFNLNVNNDPYYLSTKHYDYPIFLKDNSDELLFVRMKSVDNNSSYDYSEVYYAYNYHNGFTKMSEINIISQIFLTNNGILYGLAADRHPCENYDCLKNINVVFSANNGATWDILTHIPIDTTYFVIDFFCNQAGNLMYLWQLQYGLLDDCFYSIDNGVTFNRISLDEFNPTGNIVYTIHNPRDDSTDILVVDSLNIYKSSNLINEPLILLSALPKLYPKRPYIEFFPDNPSNAIYGNYLPGGYYISYDKCANWQSINYDYDFNYGSIKPVAGTTSDIIGSAQVYFCPTTGTRPIMETECFPTNIETKSIAISSIPFGNTYILIGPTFSQDHGFSYLLKKYNIINDSWQTAGWVDNAKSQDDLLAVSSNNDLFVCMKAVSQDATHTSYIINWSADGVVWNTIDLTETTWHSFGDREFICGYYNNIPYAVIANYKGAIWRVNLHTSEVQEIALGDDEKRIDNRLIYQSNENKLFFCYAGDTGGSASGKSFVSHDFGFTWQDIKIEQIDTRVKNISYIASNPLNDQNLIALAKVSYISSFRFLETFDNGETWSEILDLDTLNLRLNNNMWTRVTNIIPVVNNDQVTWYANIDSVILIRTGQTTWEKISINVNGQPTKLGFIKNFAIDPNNGSNVIIKNEAGFLYRGELVNSIDNARPSNLLSVTYRQGLIYFNYCNQSSKMTLYDLKGKIVSKIKINQSPFTIPWHGTDNNGNQLPSDIYFARAEDEHGNVATAKVVLVK